jgi:outer membrane protein OmpA-like peptidoglycan-associated protein
VQEREQAQADMASSPAANAEAERTFAELSEARARIQALEAQTAALEEQLATRDAARAEARAALDAEYQERLARADAELADAQAALEDQQEALQAEQAAAKAARGKADEAEDARVAELRERVGALEAKLVEAQQASTALEDELAAAEAAHGEALSAAQAAGQASTQRIQTLYREAAELGGQLTDEGILLSLAGDELQFASGTATLPEAELPSLDRIAEFLKAQPALIIRIEGHTDSSGSAETNQTLSLARAQAVMQALIERGVPASRVSAEGLGAARPIADNATERGRRENRRVEVYAIRNDAGEG